MTELVLARAQMAMLFAFHILFAVAGMGMPVLMVAADTFRAAAIEQLAFESGEEALAHGVVIGVADRAHRGTHARIAAALAERDRGVLRTLVGMMDHILRSACHQRHVQRIEHQWRGQCGGHRRVG